MTLVLAGGGAAAAPTSSPDGAQRLTTATPATGTPRTFERVVDIPVDGLDVAPATLEQLRLAHRTRGEAFLDGRVTDPSARDWIEASDGALEDALGAHWLVRQRLHHIPRVLGAEVPVPLFAPPVLQAAQVAGLLGVVRDLCSWVVVPCFPHDPLGEFDMLPMADTLDVIELLGLSGLAYATIARARVRDATFAAVVTPVRNGFRYRTRPALRWLASGRYRDR